MKTKSVLVKVGKRHARRAGCYTESQGCLLACALKDAVPQFYAVGPASIALKFPPLPGYVANRFLDVPLPRGINDKANRWYDAGAKPEKFKPFSFTLEIPQS